MTMNFASFPILIILTAVQLCRAAEISLNVAWPIHFIPDDGHYRLVYQPPIGFPPTNISYQATDVPTRIEIFQALPGTEYQFALFYSNDTVTDMSVRRYSHLTEPDPPSNLSVDQLAGKSVQISWEPPQTGGYTQFVLRVIPLTELPPTLETLYMEADTTSFVLKDLTPGATYELKLYSMFESKESLEYLSTNVTTRPNNPGRFIVWFRNETTLLVLWQPPYPAGVFNHYKVSIEPSDALESVLYVEKEGDPPGPAQAAFNGLIPGKAYNISVQTASEDQVSLPTTAQYRTVPLAPRNVTFNKRTLTSTSFEVHWEPPSASSEFDRYQVSLGIRRMAPIIVGRYEERVTTFNDDLEPGKTYEVVVKTVSGNVFSWPTTGNITTKPLPVIQLNATSNDMGEIFVTWAANKSSHQDFYKIVYQEMDSLNGDGDVLTTRSTSYRLKKLFGGHNYSIGVVAVSNNIDSEIALAFQVTRPAPPLIVGLEAIPHGLNMTWKSDVTSLQDSYAVVYIRNDTGESVKHLTPESKAILKNLYPGAAYTIKLYAISYGLWSEPHTQQQTVYPDPPRNLSIKSISNSSVSLTWEPPFSSLHSNYIIRYRAVDTDSESWNQEIVKSESHQITDLIPGGKYVIELFSVSHRMESIEYQHVEQVLKPSPLISVEAILDTQNVTFEWIVPAGHFDHYLITYHSTSRHDSESSKQVLANGTAGDKTAIVISELKPGDSYNFVFHTVSYGSQSDPYPLETRTIPIINSDISFIYNNEDRRMLGLRYTPTPAAAAVFDKYRFQLSDPNVPVQEKNVNDTNRFVAFHDLVPGRLYNITAWTISGGVVSMPLHRQERLHPESISDINSTLISDTEITLMWNAPPGDHDAYLVQYLNSENRLIQNTTYTESILVNNLHPHKEYTFTVIVRSGSEAANMKTSEPFSKRFTTKESVPGKVHTFKAIDVKPNEVTLTWAIPQTEQHGILTGFTITYGVKSSPYSQTLDFSSKETMGTIGNLAAGKIYVFKIQAKTKVGYGSVAELEEEIPIWPPPIPNPQVFPTEVSRSSNVIRIRFRKNYFLNTNGPIVGYTLIVAEDFDKDASGLELPSWQDVQDYKSWPPYQVTEPYFPFNTTTVEEFAIGIENCVGKKGYCNGPLKPGATYKVKVRAYTSADKFTDTVYSSPIQTDQDASKVSAVAVGVLVPLLLIAIVATVLLILKKRRMGPFIKKTNNTRGKDDNLSIPESVIDTSRPVKLKDFGDHFRLMSADSDFRFSEEYEELKHVGRDQPCSAADLSANRPKNRFTNILPYDHSRIKLLPTDDEEGSDYINANYVPGYSSPREFIVTQGPLHSTRDDFWRMVWEQNCRAIVMLTRCIEKGREKCDHYWPYDTQPAYYDDIQVTILNDSQYPDWTVSEFKVCRGESSRIVKHFHFTTWPDFGVPDPPQTLIRFVRAFRERSPPDQRPIVCHCSAGVGRSGTFIALDRILQHIQKYDYVDIFGIVYEMRKERVWMVQTEQQYICIHQCLLCVLEGKENDNPPRGEIHDNEGFEDDEGIAESGM